MKLKSEVVIIGLGEIGCQTLKEMTKPDLHTITGVDINRNVCLELRKQGYSVAPKAIATEAYIICVYTTEQVIEVVKELNLDHDPLVVIESTILPGTAQKILYEYPGINLVLFPHRYNPNDPQHHIFNLNRVMAGADLNVLKRSLEFYTQYMEDDLIFVTDIEIAEICKPLENAYRFIEIVIAQEIKELCDRKGINFDRLREVMNSKWNIDMKEARNGIGGKCLPKDIELIDKFLGGKNIFSVARKLNEAYSLIHGQ